MRSIGVPGKFELREPSHQNAVDIFAGGWASDFAGVCPDVRAGPSPFFTADTRPADAARLLGINGRLDGMRVLELGPLEGAHTYQLEKLGADSILSIEANTEAYLKCLITKEITGLRNSRLLCGDFTKYIASTADTYDLIFCSGVLYHMVDPIALIIAMGRISDKCFVWTHYYDEDHYNGPQRQVRHDPRYPGVKLYELNFEREAMDSNTYFGGNRPVAVWLSRDDILSTFQQAGFTNSEIVEDNPNTEIGASFTFAAWK
jgi:hypothetical protein